jgi:hypothetical protein
MHFKKIWWVYIPVSVWGWIVAIAYLALDTYTLVVINQHYDSIRSSLIRFFPYFIGFTVIYFWIAWNTSNKRD